MVPLLKPTAGTLEPISEYSEAARFVMRLEELPLARVVNDAKIEDHHAIIPTDVEHDFEHFSDDERRIFDLVARRFLAVFHPPARYAKTTIITEVEGERFRTRGKVTLEQGWRAVYGTASGESSKPDEPATASEEEGESGELPVVVEDRKSSARALRARPRKRDLRRATTRPRYS